MVNDVVNSPSIDHFTVVIRSGETLWTGEPHSLGLAAFTAEFARPLTDDEKVTYRIHFDAVVRAFDEVNDANLEAAELLKELEPVLGIQ